eukprot:gene13449-biopygen20029
MAADRRRRNCAPGCPGIFGVHLCRPGSKAPAMQKRTAPHKQGSGCGAAAVRWVLGVNAHDCAVHVLDHVLHHPAFTPLRWVEARAAISAGPPSPNA